MSIGGGSRGDKLIDPGLDAAAGEIITASRLTDFGQTITIRRGGSSLAAQVVRLVRMATSQVMEGPGSEQTEQRVLVVGTTALDIAAGDRFNDANGTLYEVDLVRPNRQYMVAAEARAIQ